MNSGDLLAEGLGLMLLGMGTVFVFLTILVYATSLMSTLVQKYVPAQPAAKSSHSGPGGQLNDQTLLAVISAAIHAHRAKK